ncbi:MAG TPA: hypothetical protein VES69_09870 [Pyrinomonadaceae bacterium]|nr:hypothetical protein [Pyrinomonadaceae bacterium]
MIANRQPVSSVAQSLGIGEKLLHMWKFHAAGRLEVWHSPQGTP